MNPATTSKPHKPWIGDKTLDLLDQRIVARSNRNLRGEKALTAAIRASVKADGTNWLNNLLETGSSVEIQKLRKGSGTRQKEGRLHDLSGALVDRDDRAQTFAEFFETRQWEVRPVTAHVSNVQLAPTLQFSNKDISSQEIVAAAKPLKPKKAVGLDELPPEFWKRICREDSSTCKWAVELCYRVWIHTDVPRSWHEALVSAVCKRGNVAMCENYRPISLLPIGYMLFASILLRRTVDGGAENRIWHTQFGFRSGRGTADALVAAKRLVESALSEKDGKLIRLALDWSKAFDSVDPDRLVLALSRFGIPEGYCTLIRAIYSNRQFIVHDAGVRSNVRQQHFGISQGCPLSPFLLSEPKTDDRYVDVDPSGLIPATVDILDTLFVVKSSQVKSSQVKSSQKPRVQ